MLCSDTAVAVGTSCPAKFLCSLGLGTISESHSGMQQSGQTETAPDHEHCDCSGSLLDFCHEGKVAENLCNLLTSPNRCRTTFFKYISWNQSQEQFLLISEMAELSSAGCRCRSLDSEINLQSAAAWLPQYVSAQCSSLSMEASWETVGIPSVSTEVRGACNPVKLGFLT